MWRALLVLALLAGCEEQDGEGDGTADAGLPADAGASDPGDAGAPAWRDERSLPNRWSKPEPLPAPVNGRGGWIDQPWISPDGSRLLFVYYDCGVASAQRPGAQGFFDIYEAQRRPDGSWAEPVALPPGINGPINEAAAVESFDGSRLWFTSQDLEQAKQGRTQRFLNVARRGADGKWGSPKKLGPLVNPAGMQQDTPSLTGDGRALFFMRSAVQPVGVDPDEQMHVWFATRDDPQCDDCWSAAQALPAPVAGAREIQPMIRPSGTTLYFSQEIGGRIALVVSHRADDGSWSTPAPLLDLHDDPTAIGEGAASLTADANTLYFARAKPTGAAGDPCTAVRFDLYSAQRLP